MATPALGECREHGLVEVQAGRRCGDRAGHARVDRLVARHVGGVRAGIAPPDVGRQRHFAVPVEPFDERSGAGEREAEEAILARLHRRRGAARKLQRRAGLAARGSRAPAPTPSSGPTMRSISSSTLPPVALRANTRALQHARVVEHDEVAARAAGAAGRRTRDRRSRMPSTCSSRLPPRSRRRHLRDQLRRQLVVEIRERVGTGQGVVPGGGLEPPRYRYRRILSQNDLLLTVIGCQRKS